MLKGENILLRSLQDSDLVFLQDIENNKENWQYGGERKIYSKQDLASYILNSRTNIQIAKQYRFVIDLKSNPIGFIDLFNYTNTGVGIGIIISKYYRNKGFAKEALTIMIDYIFITLGLKKIKAIISKDNLGSIKLFNSCGFDLEREEKDLQYFINLAEK